MPMPKVYGGCEMDGSILLTRNVYGLNVIVLLPAPHLMCTHQIVAMRFARAKCLCSIENIHKQRSTVE